MAEVLALVDDLMFLSRVREAARPYAVSVTAMRQPPATAGPDVRLILVDLDRFGQADRLKSLRGLPGLAGAPVVGFLSHVNADRAREAREAGLTRVLARSAFVQELPALLAAAAAGGTPEPPNE
jgi:DNA-binding NarL/FixJ family response regulator